jgi:osmotically-inducible protein OsmY
MNKAYIIGRFFMVMALIAVIAGCAGTATRESTGEYIDDSVLTTKVTAEIVKDPVLNAFQIKVESFKGVVQLSGFVNSAQDAYRAVSLANSVAGVQGVKNSLVVK